MTDHPERAERLEELVRIARNRCCGAEPCEECLIYEAALDGEHPGVQAERERKARERGEGCL